MYRPDNSASTLPDPGEEPVSLTSTGTWPTGTWPAISSASGISDRLASYVSVLNHDLTIDPTAILDERSDVAALSAARLTTLRQHIDTLRDPVGFLAELFENAPIGFAVWKNNGHALLTNHALRELFGSQPPPSYNIFADQTANHAGFGPAMRRAFAGEAVSLPPIWYDPHGFNSVSDEGKRVAISMSLFPIRDRLGAVEFVAAVYRNDTQAMLAQQQLRLQSEQLEQRVLSRTAQLEEANEELESFSYSVSHDLRAPLRTIDAFASLLAEDRDSTLSPLAQDNLRRIRGAALRMGNLINDLLTFSRMGKQSLRLETTAPMHLVQQVLRELEVKLRNRVVKVRVKKLPLCQADPALLREVFLNLLDNAIKFTAKTPNARIEIGTRIQDNRLVWYVSDNGVGFDMAHYDQLFGVFSRLHTTEEFEGTGVGLALVHRIVRRHGGHIWAQAERNKGATFNFTLGD
jgi:signal transduction histidine kinase